MRALPAALSLVLAGCFLPAETAGLSAPAAADADLATTAALTRSTAPTRPRLRVRVAVRGLQQPWDVKRLPSGVLLITERDRKTLRVWNGQRLRTVRFPRARVWAAGETGLMSLAVDPKFTKNRRVYTCQGGHRAGGGHDVRVIAWLPTGVESPGSRHC